MDTTVSERIVDAALETHTTHGLEAALDYLPHEKTYATFLHVTKWFVVHLAFDLVGLYFMVIEHNLVAGLAFIVLGTIVLVAGNLMAPAVARNPVDPPPLA